MLYSVTDSLLVVLKERFPLILLDDPSLSLAYLEDLGPTGGTIALCSWPSVLQRYGPSILHLSFGAAFHTIPFHRSSSFVLNVG